MPGGRDECPVEVRINNLSRGRDAAYLEYRRHYNDTQRSIDTYCRIRPTEGDTFGLYVALYPDFDFGSYTHLKVSLFVDGWYVRTQYLEKHGVRFLYIVRGRKYEEAMKETVEFACMVGDVQKPGDHELDGTISIEVSLGRMVHRRPRKPKANFIQETDTFKHGPPEPVNPPKNSKLMFASAPRGDFTPMRWYFLYAEKNYRSGTAPVPSPFAGLGKRSRDVEEENNEGTTKPTRVVGVDDEEDLGIQQREPIELFPEYDDVLYVEVPAYGGLA